jgi:hypothetical protein
VFEDAWSIVDSLHRLRELLDSFPNLQKRSMTYKVFRRVTEPVEALRNHAQHLRGQLSNPELGHLPVWGTVSWLWMIDDRATHFKSGVIFAGADDGMLRLFLTPGGLVYHDRLDHITISTNVEKLSLSEAMRLVVQLARGLEGGIGTQFDGHEALPMVDGVMIGEIVMQEEGEAEPPSPSS